MASKEAWKKADVVAAGDVSVKLPQGMRRYVTAFLCLCVSTICYADRTNMGIALPAFVTNKKEQGEVLSAFFYGYMCTQIPGGYFAAKFGAKIVLLTGVIVWTLFDLSTVLVAKCLTCLFFTRAGMGLGEGILFPCMHQIAGAWYPVQERSRLVSLVASGSDLGTISALMISPAIMAASGWQRIFVVFGVLSFIWVVAYVIMGVSRPEDDPHITNEERNFIIRNRTVDPETHRRQSSRAELDTHAMNWRVLLTSRPAWAIYVAHMCYNYSWYILLGWIPQYFNQVLNLDLAKKGGFAAALPYMCGYTGTLLFGRLGDLLVTRGFRELHVRQMMNAFSFLGCAFFLFSLRLAKSAPVAVALLCLTLFTSRAAMAGYWVNMIDVAPNHAAHVMGVSNTFGTIPGIIGNVVTGAILDASGSWDLVFAIAALVLVFGAVVFHCFASDKSIYAQSGSSYGEGYSSTSTTSSSFPGSPNYGLSLSTSIPELRDEEESLLENPM
ncbi:Major Facilitator Superfamily [Phytophthora infestans]|uniref:Major Facilitator Superfamily n=1 Tax=Phytophthora infestans TaxID=4787 RepID=A0A833SFI8_PHYIN|nr:Major Facilitator Superfamily [Phytophthora infestans]KAF4138329.1 Major Facilitator Superfamily [Phytophthora infestans]